MAQKVFCGIAYNNHDSSVCFAVNDEIKLVLEAERVFHQKKKRCSKTEMDQLIRYGLGYLDLSISDVDFWCAATLGYPLLTEEDIFESDGFTPKNPFIKKVALLGKERDILFTNHHLSHAASYFMSDFSDAVVITCDGGGDYSSKVKKPDCNAVFYANGLNIKRLDLNTEELMTSKFYGICATFLYNEDNHSEGKLMALAALGQVNFEFYQKLESVLDELGTLPRENGLEILNTNFAEVKNGAFTRTQDALDFATTVQKLFSDRRISDTQYVLKSIKHDSKNLVFAGGSCLNLDANREIYDTFSNKNQFIAPCCDDTGQALGAVCMAIVKYLGLRPQVTLPYLGMGQEHYEYDSKTLDMVVDTLMRDGIAIVHNGKAEIGPRALGNRSLIARADSIEVKKKLSEQVKQRESYRPVAPLVLKEKLGEYFIGPSTSPFMLYKHDVRDEVMHIIIGCAHVDKSARVQTVEKNNNPFLYDLIKRFGDKTGTYVLLNTSLNLKGDPIANDLMQSLKIYDQIDGEKIIIANGMVL